MVPTVQLVYKLSKLCTPGTAYISILCPWWWCVTGVHPTFVLIGYGPLEIIVFKKSFTKSNGEPLEVGLVEIVSLWAVKQRALGIGEGRTCPHL